MGALELLAGLKDRGGQLLQMQADTCKAGALHYIMRVHTHPLCPVSLLGCSGHVPAHSDTQSAGLIGLAVHFSFVVNSAVPTLGCIGH
jgi:hypothetical protein